jgi:RND family efflux transporter MFP subunit
MIAVGDAIEAAPQALPAITQDGSILALDNRLDPTSRTLRVQAALPNADDRLRAGMAFAIEMHLPGEPYPEIDALAIQWDATGPFVWVGRNGRAVREPVRIVQRNADRVLVAGALAVGERVISEGVQRLREGMELRFVGDPPPEPDTGDGAALTRAAAAPVSDG